MSIPVQNPIAAYTGNGSATQFAYNWYLVYDSDMTIQIEGVTISPSLYTVTGVGNVTGGNVVFHTAPAAGARLLLQRDIPLERETNYVNNGDLLAATVNADFDRIWMALQDVNTAGSYTFRVQDKPLAVVPQSAADRARKYLTCDDNGNPQFVTPIASTAEGVLSALAEPTGGGLVGTYGGGTVQDAINILSPYYKYGKFSDGAVITSEYQTLYSHTDAYGNAYWWTYVGNTANFPLSVPANYAPDVNWMLVVTGSFTVPLATEVDLTGVSAQTGTTVTYTVADASGFTVGKYAFIYSTNRLGQHHCGCFQVVSKTATHIEVQQSSAKISASGNVLLGACKIRPMNIVIPSNGGVTANGFVKKIEGVVFDGAGTASYGLMLGGGHNNSGLRRHLSSVGRLSFCAFVNQRKTGGSSDDVVGVLVGGGSSCGVYNVAVNGSKIGIETYRNGSLIGTGAYVYDVTNDAFKAEFTCNNYLYYCAAIKCASGFTSRYSAGAEYATIVCSDAAYGVLTQFNGYCSIRDYEFYGMTSAGCYATQESFLLMSNSGELVNCAYTYRVRKGSRIEQLTGTATDTNSTNGYDVTSGSLLLPNAQVTVAAPNTWDGQGSVNINATDHSIITLTLSGTVTANGRQAWQASFRFNFNETGQNKLRMGVRYSDSALPIGLLIPTPSAYDANSSRIYAINYTAAAIVINMKAYAYVF